MILRLKTRESRSPPGLPNHLNTSPNAGWSSPVARQAHNLKVTGSNPVPATNITEQNPHVRKRRGAFHVQYTKQNAFAPITPVAKTGACQQHQHDIRGRPGESLRTSSLWLRTLERRLDRERQIDCTKWLPQERYAVRDISRQHAAHEQMWNMTLLENAGDRRHAAAWCQPRYPRSSGPAWCGWRQPPPLLPRRPWHTPSGPCFRVFP